MKPKAIRTRLYVLVCFIYNDFENIQMAEKSIFMVMIVQKFLFVVLCFSTCPKKKH
jgi:hypothetical protein